MRISDSALLTILLLASSANAIPSAVFQRRCAELSHNFSPSADIKVLASEFLPNGTRFTNPENHPSCQRQPYTTLLVDICRLQLNVTTSKTSNVLVEVWMPTSWEQKQKRVIVTGNGGLGGCTQFYDMSYLNYLGFAAIGSNNGHLGDTGVPFLNRPEVVKDFVYRAVHTAATLGKRAVKAFYRKDLGKSYFVGCSTGGRQGLKAAQDFPDLFDGILSGAASNDFNNLMSISGSWYKTLGSSSSPNFVTAEQWATVSDLVYQQCDGIDGVMDRVIEDPMKCVPRPEALLCQSGETWASNKCLTSAQVTAVRKFYEPLYGNNGSLLYPRINPGGELASARFWLHGNPPQYLQEWFRYAVYNDVNWNVDDNFDLSAVDHANLVDPFGQSTWKSDLSGLKSTGNKLITYHGLMDGLITSENSYRYYELVSRTMGLASSDLDEFFRYFPIPGLNHCASGNGAWYVGAGSQITAWSPAEIDSYYRGSLLYSLVKWVEDGVAPERILGRNIAANGTVLAEKRHCKWPLQNVYLGGDASRQSNWGCQ
ncbi:Tannase and feruloyl esterase [Arthrobotrys megalospora]